MNNLRIFPFILFLLVLLTGKAKAESEPYKILILNSYHKNLSWSESTIDGIEAGLKEHLETPYNLHIEFLDSKRTWNQTYIDLFCKMLNTKYKSNYFDLIFANDDNALHFLKAYKAELFPDTPVVVSGINHSGKFPHDYTGLKEEIDLCSNIKLIERFHPDLKHLYIIVDNTKTGKLIKRKFIGAYRRSACSAPYSFLSDYTLQELLEKIKSLKPGSVIFLTTFNKDKRGNYQSFDKIIESISQATSLPIYAPWDFYLGKGILGGKLIEGFEHGKTAAKIGYDILQHHKAPSEIPIAAGPSAYKFDYDQIKKFQISLSDLPEKAEIINNPYEKVKENLNIIIFTTTLIILLILLILILLRYNKIKKQRIIEQQYYLDKQEKINEDLEVAFSKAEKANRLKTNFLANISHEIRTPMNAIIGFAKLITEHNTNKNQEEIQRYKQSMQVNSEILLNLINDIIDLSKIETDQLKINYVNFDINQMLDDIKEYAHKENTKNLDIFIEKAVQNGSFYIRSDESRLRQVYINLLNNAIKFSNSGAITLGYQIAREALLCFVKDTGIGMDEKEQQQIFEHFQQADSSSTREYGGAGLGLSLSKGIIKNMKGKIWVESEKNKGSVFYFQIPLYPGKERKADHLQTKSESNNHYNWEGKKILIVEDSRMAYELIKKLLKGTNAKFELEKDGKSALDRCITDDSIDLVLMDIQLPILDGYSATKQIKEKKPKLPIIAQTANAMSDDRKNAMQMGCDEYIAKPIDREELAQKIDRLLKTKHH